MTAGMDARDKDLQLMGDARRTGSSGVRMCMGVPAGEPAGRRKRI